MLKITFIKNLRSSILFTGLLLSAFSFLLSGCFKEDNLEEEAIRREEAFLKQLAADTVAIKQFLANRQITNYGKTKSGIFYIEKTMGSGVQPRVGGRVSTDYTLTLMKHPIVKGDTLDTSFKKQPFTFNLSQGNAIYGYLESVLLMNVGDKTQFIIPSGLAYGENANGKIPANAILVFDIELLEAK